MGTFSSLYSLGKTLRPLGQGKGDNGPVFNYLLKINIILPLIASLHKIRFNSVLHTVWQDFNMRTYSVT